MNFKGTKENWKLNDTNHDIFGGNDNYHQITCGEGVYNYNLNEQSGFSITGYLSKENAKLIVSSYDLLECLIGLSDAISSGNGNKLSDYNLKSKELIKNICEETV